MILGSKGSASALATVMICGRDLVLLLGNVVPVNAVGGNFGRKSKLVVGEQFVTHGGGHRGCKRHPDVAGHLFTG